VSNSEPDPNQIYVFGSGVPIKFGRVFVFCGSRFRFAFLLNVLASVLIGSRRRHDLILESESSLCVSFGAF